MLFCRIHNPPDPGAGPPNTLASIRSDLCFIQADAGLYAATEMIPMKTLTTSGGVRNCQTETPAARATTNSILRERLRKVIIDPNRTANGSACSATVGVLRNERP